jgi:hypothetical protein
MAFGNTIIKLQSLLIISKRIAKPKLLISIKHGSQRVINRKSEAMFHSFNATEINLLPNNKPNTYLLAINKNDVLPFAPSDANNILKKKCYQFSHPQIKTNKLTLLSIRSVGT